MAADRGYIWDDPRNAWTRSTLSHNIVTVDGRSQEGRPEPAALELFGAGAGVEVVQASARQYEQCGRYQRTCALVQVPGGGTYAVDFFRVDGGRLHQYGFHCNGRLTGIEGADLEPADEEIEWLDNLRAGRPRQPFTAAWQDEEVRMDLTLLNPVDRLLLADAPGWRSDTGEQLHAPPVQQVLAERRGADLSSRYAAVIAPHVEESPVRGARLLLDDPASGALGIAVDREGCTDYILSAPDGGAHDLGPVSIEGRFGFASVDGEGNLRRAFLLCGTTLECGGRSLRLDRAQVPLEVASAAGRTFRLAEALPDPETLPGTWLLAADTGYEVESASERSITVRDYPAVPCGEIRLLGAAAFVEE